MNLEGSLVEKLRKLEALHAGTTVDGERDAAQRAAEKIRARLAELRSQEKDIEMRYSLPDPWTRKLFVALCRRYGVTPYRLSRQRAGTIMLRAPATFQQQTLWPEFLALSKELRAHLEDLTDRVIREAIHPDVTEPAETEAKALPAQALVDDYSEKHYRAWIDQPVPALDGKTPRQASTDPSLQQRLLRLIEGLESANERARMAGKPGYDPSWMWSELGLR